MREDDAGNFASFSRGAGLERVAASVKEHVRHIDDEAAGGVARLQNRIQLAEKLGAKLGLFGLGLRGGAARFFGFRPRRHAAVLARKPCLLRLGRRQLARPAAGLRPRRWPSRLRLLASGVLGGFLRFLLHAHGFSLCGFGLLASLLGFLAALTFQLWRRAGLGFAFSAALLSAAIFAWASSSAFCFTAMTRASSAVSTTSRRQQ